VSTQAFDWKNPAHIRTWNADREKFWSEFRRKNALPEKTGELLEQQILGDFVPHVEGVALMGAPGDRKNRIAFFAEGRAVGLSEHLKSLDRDAEIGARRSGIPARPYSAMNLIGRAGDGSIVIAPPARGHVPKKRQKSIRMFAAELQKKASRELACGLLGGVVKCRNGHAFAVNYECGNRYCIACGPDRANECFAQIKGRIQLATARLLDCENLHCSACYWFRRGRILDDAGGQRAIPHWPPPKTGPRAKHVIAILDFMLPKAGVPDRFTARRMNAAIKKTIRTITRRAGITRREYGYLFTDEYGSRNTNLHAHGIWVGPRLDYQEIRRAWRKAIGSKDAIFTIRMCESVVPALYHAIKYPAKFGEHAAGEWLAELEIAFHRVRRLHRLGAFYNMPKPEDEPEHDGRMKKCPGCGEQLSEPTFNRLLKDLYAEGCRDLRTLVREIGKAKCLNAAGLSP
jgi:hypothetical protein